MYSIAFRHDLNLLDIRWAGAFTDEIVTEYARDLKQRFLLERFKPGYLLRIDMTDSMIQTQDTISSFARNFVDFPLAHRIAIITSSPLMSLQVRRAMPQPYLQIFPFPEPALKWLLSEVEPQNAP